MPDGLDTEVGQRGAQLSAGERQLVALVRASLVDPDVLVLDEATSSVDALTEVRIARALEKLAAGRTTIAIAHRLSTAARADRVLVLEHGRLVEDGPHVELLRPAASTRRCTRRGSRRRHLFSRRSHPVLNRFDPIDDVRGVARVTNQGDDRGRVGKISARPWRSFLSVTVSRNGCATD